MKFSALRAIALSAFSLLLQGPGLSVHAESLYQEQSFKSLIGDHRAHRIGDNLTVQVFENSSATSTADTGTRRQNGIGAELSHRGNVTAETGIRVNGDFDSGGRTQRASRLLTTLTVTVRAIFPNGDLSVAGEQLLTVNQELQKVTLEGRVRPQDISDGNVVLSSRLADARITYLGEGELSDRNRRPWWRQVLDLVGF